jgi:hypothetical protein
MSFWEHQSKQGIFYSSFPPAQSAFIASQYSQVLVNYSLITFGPQQTAYCSLTLYFWLYNQQIIGIQDYNIGCAMFWEHDIERNAGGRESLDFSEPSCIRDHHRRNFIQKIARPEISLVLIGYLKRKVFRQSSKSHYNCSHDDKDPRDE